MLGGTVPGSAGFDAAAKVRPRWTESAVAVLSQTRRKNSASAGV
jgi:hypothetical protein